MARMRPPQAPNRHQTTLSYSNSGRANRIARFSILVLFAAVAPCLLGPATAAIQSPLPAAAPQGVSVGPAPEPELLSEGAKGGKGGGGGKGKGNGGGDDGDGGGTPTVPRTSGGGTPSKNKNNTDSSSSERSVDCTAYKGAWMAILGAVAALAFVNLGTTGTPL